MPLDAPVINASGRFVGSMSLFLRFASSAKVIPVTNPQTRDHPHGLSCQRKPKMHAP
jgi:hypothetical protein